MVEDMECRIREQIDEIYIKKSKEVLYYNYIKTYLYYQIVNTTRINKDDNTMEKAQKLAEVVKNK